MNKRGLKVKVYFSVMFTQDVKSVLIVAIVTYIYLAFSMEGGDIGLLFTLIPKVLNYHFPTSLLDNFGDFLLNFDMLVH